MSFPIVLPLQSQQSEENWVSTMPNKMALVDAALFNKRLCELCAGRLRHRVG